MSVAQPLQTWALEKRKGCVSATHSVSELGEAAIGETFEEKRGSKEAPEPVPAFSMDGFLP